MLTEKDYCDYDTCVALKELGFSEPTLAYYHGFLSSKPLLYLVIDEDSMPEDGVNVFNLLSNSNKYKDSKNIDAPTLWEAQKWLRHTHNLHISTKPYPCEDGLMWMYEIRRFTPYLVCVIKNKTGFREAEEALSEGIKEAVKILKENEDGRL